MNTSIEFPDDWHDFLKSNQFIDSKEVYTNGSELIQVYIVEQLIEHLLKEQEEQIKTRDESLEKAREEIKWLRGMLKEQEPVKPERQHSGGGTTWWNVCGNCRTVINPNDKYCHECGRNVKWNERL